MPQSVPAGAGGRRDFAGPQRCRKAVISSIRAVTSASPIAIRPAR
jgi:hypothetical protein